MFRRPALCVLDSAFADAALVPADQVVRLSSRARNELFALSVLGPLLQTDLRASWCPRLFCMDASPSGAGLCSVGAPVNAIQELLHAVGSSCLSGATGAGRGIPG